MAGTDHQAAMELSRQINANPRRRNVDRVLETTVSVEASYDVPAPKRARTSGVASLSQVVITHEVPQRETRASKRARLSYHLSPFTSPSSPPSPSQCVGFSSPLSSPPTSDISSPSTPRPSLIVRLKAMPTIASPGPRTQDEDRRRLSSGDDKPNTRSRNRYHPVPNTSIPSQSFPRPAEIDGPSEGLNDSQVSRGKKRKSIAQDFSPGAQALGHRSQKHANTTSAAIGVPKDKVRAKLGPKPAPYHKNVQQSFPEPYGQPMVWADKRQQLCDGEVGSRDKFTDEVIIAQVYVFLSQKTLTWLSWLSGGGRELDDKGKMVQKKSQETSQIAQAFKSSMIKSIAVGVIAGMHALCSTNAVEELPLILPQARAMQSAQQSCHTTTIF